MSRARRLAPAAWADWATVAAEPLGLRFRPLPTKTCVLLYTDSALDNAEADPDEEGSDDEWLAKAKQKVSVSVLSMVHWCVWWLKTIWRKLDPFQSLS